MRLALICVSRTEKLAALAGFSAAMLIFLSGYLIGAQKYGSASFCVPEQKEAAKNVSKATLGVLTPRKVHALTVREGDAQ